MREPCKINIFCFLRVGAFVPRILNFENLEHLERGAFPFRLFVLFCFALVEYDISYS